jgi:hypothetical protein
MTAITNESGKLREAKQNPSAMFGEPQEVLAANDLSKDEKRAILEQWKVGGNDVLNLVTGAIGERGGGDAR